MSVAITVVEKTGWKIMVEKPSVHSSRDCDGITNSHHYELLNHYPIAEHISSHQATVDIFFRQAGFSLWLLKPYYKAYAYLHLRISIVLKPGMVVTELVRQNVYAVTSAERGKTHTIVACVSTSGYILPPVRFSSSR